MRRSGLRLHGRSPVHRRAAAGPFGQQDAEARLVEHRDAERERLVVLGSRAVSRDHEAGLLRHRAGDLPAERLRPPRRPRPGSAGQRAGDHDGHPGQRRGLRLPLPAATRALLGQPHPGGAPLSRRSPRASPPRTSPAPTRRWSGPTSSTRGRAPRPAPPRSRRPSRTPRPAPAPRSARRAGSTARPGSATAAGVGPRPGCCSSLTALAVSVPLLVGEERAGARAARRSARTGRPRRRPGPLSSSATAAS